jgi:Cys-tRNA(Pro)/Cys-tRNA(Cys) deacylase
VAARGTRATQELTRLGIAHSVHAYHHQDPDSSRGGSYGIEAAVALGLPPAQVFKTLIAIVDGSMTVAVVPVASQLNLKALAHAAGGKRAYMAKPAAAQRVTGYVTGGISPIGLRKRLPVVIDSTALDWPAVYCSAGQRGLQLRLAPADLVRVTSAAVAPIARTSGGTGGTWGAGGAGGGGGAGGAGGSGGAGGGGSGGGS